MQSITLVEESVVHLDFILKICSIHEIIDHYVLRQICRVELCFLIFYFFPPPSVPQPSYRGIPPFLIQNSHCFVVDNEQYLE